MGARKMMALSAWGLLLLSICFGLGYPTLNRYYPPSTPGLRDSKQYYAMVERGPNAASGHWKYRILVPFLARPIYGAASGHLRTWNPTSFALLMVNSAFCAAAALLVSVLAYLVGANCSIAVIAAFAYLLNFTVANYQLSGMVDSADAFWFVLLNWALLRSRWWLLPAIALGAGLTKETFLPIAFVFGVVWMLMEPGEARLKKFLAILSMVVLGVLTMLTVRSIIDHSLATPWGMVAEERQLSPQANYNLLAMFRSWNLWLTAGWSFFLFFTAHRFSPGWRYGALSAAAVVVFLVAWDNAGWDNLARPLFNVLGPLLAISFALTAGSVQKLANRGPGTRAP